jgi:hypothetical protein
LLQVNVHTNLRQKERDCDEGQQNSHDMVIGKCRQSGIVKLEDPPGP